MSMSMVSGPLGRMEFRYKKMVLGGWVALLFACLALGFVLESMEVHRTGFNTNILLMKDAIFVYTSTMVLLPMLSVVLGSLLPYASSEQGDWHWLLGRPVGREQVFKTRLVFDAIVFLAAVLLYYALAFSFKHATEFVFLGIPFWLAIYGLSAWSRSRELASIPSIFVALIGSVGALLLVWWAFELGWGVLRIIGTPASQWDPATLKQYHQMQGTTGFWFHMWIVWSIVPMGMMLFVMGVKSAKTRIEQAPLSLKGKPLIGRWFFILAGYYLVCFLSPFVYVGTLYLMARP